MVKEISIKGDYIKLDQFLKFVGVAQTGGHGKIMIKGGQVQVNDEITLERGKKLKKNDKIEIAGEGTYLII